MCKFKVWIFEKVYDLANFSLKILVVSNIIYNFVTKIF